jgi:oxygen-independent coproporphyrinogen-3 oxidase
LHALNRQQQAGDVYWLIERASREFTNISIDLIVGLPGLSEQEWKQVVQTIATWPITHVSIYFLTVHEDTPLYFKVQTQKISLPLEDNVVDSYLWAIDYLAQQGFEQYEISNFARPGFRSQHNSMYWQRKPFKGFGLGAWSFDGQRRLQNKKNLMQYMNDAQSSGQVTLFEETLTPKQEHLEQIMLGLRQKSGVAIEDLCRKKMSMHIDFNEIIAELIDKGYMQQNNSRIWLTPIGFTMHQSIVTKLSCEH